MQVWAMRAVVVLALVTVACGGGGENSEEDSPSTVLTASDGRTVAMDKEAYPVFPDADAGADPAVSAEDGGRGFTGEGWETNTDFDLIGDPRAVKGGVFRQAATDFPTTLRCLGSNLSVFNQTLHGLVYEPLITLHPTTLEYVPVLATHWQVSEDQLTYRFRLDPNARFNDGMPVTAEDVVATWDLYVDPTVQDPLRNAIYNNFERPIAESPYIVSIKAKEPGWIRACQTITDFCVLGAAGWIV